MFRIMIMLIPIFFIASCAEVHSYTSASGRAQYEVECNGTAISMDVCYKKAASLCPNGYKILNRDVQDRGGLYSNAGFVGRALHEAMPSGVKGINIECK